MYDDEKKCFNALIASLRCDSKIYPFYEADLLPKTWRRSRPTSVWTPALAWLARLEREREREPEDTLNSPREQLYDLLAIRALSLCPVNLWVERKSAFSANCPAPGFCSPSVPARQSPHEDLLFFFPACVNRKPACLQRVCRRSV